MTQEFIRKSHLTECIKKYFSVDLTFDP